MTRDQSILFALLLSALFLFACVSQRKAEESKPTTQEQAAVDRQVGLDKADIEARAFTNRVNNLTYFSGVGMVVAGVVCIALVWIVPALGSKTLMLGLGLVGSGILIDAFALAMQDHRSLVSKVAVILIIVVFSGVGVVSIVLAWTRGRTVFNLVKLNQEGKALMPEPVKQGMFGPEGLASRILSPADRRLVAQAKIKIKKETSK